MPTHLPRVAAVTPQHGVRVTRVLFAAVGALLGPLAAFWLFGWRAEVTAWLPLTVVTPLLAAGVAGRVIRGGSTAGAMARVFGWSLLGGIANGIVCGEFFLASGDRGEVNALGVVCVFGTLYGLLGGLAFGAAFAIWTLAVRTAVNAPSALGRARLTMHLGMFLSLAGAFGVAVYRVDGFTLASLATLAVGMAVLVRGLAAIGALSRFVAAVRAGTVPGVRVVRRHDGLNAAALAWATPLDHAIVHEPDHTDGQPFREALPVLPVALVDEGLVNTQKAIRSAGAVGLAVAASICALGALGVLCGLSGAMAASCINLH